MWVIVETSSESWDDGVEVIYGPFSTREEAEAQAEKINIEKTSERQRLRGNIAAFAVVYELNKKMGFDL